MALVVFLQFCPEQVPERARIDNTTAAGAPFIVDYINEVAFQERIPDFSCSLILSSAVTEQMVLLDRVAGVANAGGGIRT